MSKQSRRQPEGRLQTQIQTAFPIRRTAVNTPNPDRLNKHFDKLAKIIDRDRVPDRLAAQADQARTAIKSKIGQYLDHLLNEEQFSESYAVQCARNYGLSCWHTWLSEGTY